MKLKALITAREETLHCLHCFMTQGKDAAVLTLVAIPVLGDFAA